MSNENRHGRRRGYKNESSAKCPDCGESLYVIDARPALTVLFRRRRMCANGHRMTTYEIAAKPGEVVVFRVRPMKNGGAKSEMRVYHDEADLELALVKRLTPSEVEADADADAEIDAEADGEAEV